jgi:MFS family permease
MAAVTETAAPGAITPHGRVYPWIVVVLLMVLYTSSYIDRTVLSLLVKPIRADLQITDTEYSILAGFAFVIMYSIAGIPCGWIADRWSRRGLIAIGSAFWSVMTAACGLANSFGTLFAARVGVGIGEATLSPGSYSIISDYFKKERMSRALSLYALGIPIGSGLALVAGGMIVAYATQAGTVELPLFGVLKPWQLVFVAVGLPGLLLAPLVLLIIREPQRSEITTMAISGDRPTFGATLRYMWTRRGIYGGATFGVGLAALFGYGITAWYPTYLQRVHGFSIANAGLLLGFGNVVFGVIGSLTAGWWADWLAARGRDDAQFVVNSWYAVGLLICGALGPIVPLEWLSIAMVVVTPFFSKTAIGAMAALIQIVTPNRMRGQISAIYLFAVALVGQSIGPTAVAVCTDYLFKDDNAVGWSLALVGTVFCSLGVVAFQIGRRSLLRGAK